MLLAKVHHALGNGCIGMHPSRVFYFLEYLFGNRPRILLEQKSSAIVQYDLLVEYDPELCDGET
jgi:hypothetical protein